MEKTKNKFCSQCGMPVDLRVKGSFKLNKDLCPVNPVYHYICSKKCEDKLRESLS